MSEKNLVCKCGAIKKYKLANSCKRCSIILSYKDLKIKLLCAVFTANKLGFYPSRQNLRNLLSDEPEFKIEYTLNNMRSTYDIISRHGGYRLAQRGVEFFKFWGVEIDCDFFLDV